VKLTPEVEAIIRAALARQREEDDMSAGREHYERRIAQQRAADKRRVKRKHEYDWKKEN